MASLQFVKGLDELKKAFNELPKVIGKRVIRGAARVGSQIIRDRAIVLAPTLQEMDHHNPPRIKGMMRAALYEKAVGELSNDLVQTFIVGVRSGPRGRKYAVQTSTGWALVEAFYWKWIEFGHYYMPPRETNATTGKKVNQKWHRNNSKATGTAVWIKEQPFLRPAFNEMKDEAVTAMVNYMAERIPKEARKLGIKTT